jgi:tRNA modification GTPase
VNKHIQSAAQQYPIVALCTPQGPGTIALIRISGQGAVDLCAMFAILPSKKRLSDLPSHTVCYGDAVDAEGNIIDTVMYIVMRKPKTFTGDDTVEITCHNNQFVIQKIIHRILELGAHQAKAGEFCQRAFLNGKIDILQAEAITELINANNEMALKQSLSQIRGSLSAQIVLMEADLLTALALCRASFEFIEEEDVEFSTNIIELVNNVIKITKDLKNYSMVQKNIRSGFRVVFLGTVNAGKSSLFNAIIGKKRAIVTDIAGTTRDSIEEGMYEKGHYLTLVDTAGLRMTDNAIEQEGIVRSLEQAHIADIILLIHDESQRLSESSSLFYEKIKSQYHEKTIFVSNKCDLLKDRNNDSFLYCSAKTGFGITAIKDVVQQKIEIVCNHKSTPFLLNTRQNELIQCIDNQLALVETILEKKTIAYELVAYHLEEIITLLSQLTGKSISEASMDKIFRDFCVGK